MRRTAASSFTRPLESNGVTIAVLMPPIVIGPDYPNKGRRGAAGRLLVDRLERVRRLARRLLLGLPARGRRRRRRGGRLSRGRRRLAGRRSRSRGLLLPRALGLLLVELRLDLLQ